MIELKHDIARTQNALDAVNGTLGQVVDRLATIEKDFRQGPRAPSAADPETIELRQPVGRVMARAVSDAPCRAAPPHVQPAPSQLHPPQPRSTASRPAADAAPASRHPFNKRRSRPPRRQGVCRRTGRLPINPDLPPDQPLEPGSGPPRFQPNAAARIAASEAALGGARPAPGAGPTGKSGFIAAARRAAQAAVETATPHAAPSEPIEVDDAREIASPRGSLMKRVKSLFIAASIVAVVVGSIQIVGHFVDLPGSGSSKSAQNANVGSNMDAEADKTATTAATDTPAAPATIAASPLNTDDTAGIPDTGADTRRRARSRGFRR